MQPMLLNDEQRIKQQGSNTTSQAAYGPQYDDVALLAYFYWEERGRPDGSSELDWFRAEEKLRSAVLQATDMQTAGGAQRRTSRVSATRPDSPGGHSQHGHQHGSGCGHTAVRHDGHIDYLQDGHLHHQRNGQVEEHELAIGPANPATCRMGHPCGGHNQAHRHGPGCGHEAVPHGGHHDYLVHGHLHHAHGDHCDDHGSLEVI